MAQLIDLKVGFTCNNNCIHCVVSDKTHERDLSFEEITHLINGYIQQYGKIKLTLTGGEVTIRKDFIDILKFIETKKMSGDIEFVDIQTNGRKFANDEIAQAAAKTIDFFLIALHSNKSEIHDKITQVNGSFEQTTKGILNIVKYSSSKVVAVQTVINSLNYNTLPELYKYIVCDLHLNECNITFPHPIGVCQSNLVVPSYEQVQPYVNRALTFCLKNGVTPYIEALPFCVFYPGDNRNYAFEFLNKRDINVIGYGGENDGQVDYANVFNEGHAKYANCEACPYYISCDGIWKEHKSIYPNENMYQLYMIGESTDED